MLVLELLLLCDSPHLGESIFGIKCIQCSGDICCCVAVCLLDVPKKSKTQKKSKNKIVCALFQGQYSASLYLLGHTCMIMEFKLVDGVQFFLVLFVLVALPPLW